MSKDYKRHARLRFYLGDYTETVQAFARAAHVTEIRLADDRFGGAGGPRDCEFDCDLALDGEGGILAVRLRGCMTVEAQLTGEERRCAWKDFARGLAIAYRVPLVELSGTSAFANPKHVGRIADSGLLMERIIDQAAREMIIDPISLRKRNFIDLSDGLLLDEIATSGDVSGFAERRMASIACGKRRGLGVAYHHKKSERLVTAYPAGPHIAEVEIDLDAERISVARYTTTTSFRSVEAQQAFETGVPRELPAISNAIIDAMGNRHIEMPATPERVWRLLKIPPMLGLS
jgi:CO/xanthine dehydrogenase Mo-binding subunit